MQETIAREGKRLAHAEALSADAAERCAMRVAVHLVEGNFEAAHAAIDDARARSQVPERELSPQEILDLPLCELGLVDHSGRPDNRTITRLEQHGMLRLADLFARRGEDLAGITNFGPRTVSRLRAIGEIWLERLNAAIARENQRSREARRTNGHVSR